MKQNDYIIANMNNPGLNAGEFRTMGMDMDNTLMLTEDQYLKSDYIKSNPLFQDENGDFSKSKFHDFYNQTLLSFQTFSTVDDDFQYDMFDYRRYEDPTGNVKSPQLMMVNVSNPDESTVSDGWINQINESPFSYRELAEKNKIWSSEQGKFIDYSPDDHALFQSPLEWIKDIFKDPLVVAKWDEDGFHDDPVTGQKVEHHKGDRKLNDEGKYYYETLNGRSLAGQEVLSGFDTLTVDGSALNKLDFFDSDDKEKTIGGTIMKTAAAVAPMFMGPVGTAYSTALVLREFGKVLPMIESLLHLVTGDDADTTFTKWANNIAGKMTAATSSQDDYLMQHPWALSNIANLASDVALQWGLQKVVASAFAKLLGLKRLLKSAENTAFETWKKNVPKATAKLESEGIAADVIKQKYGSLADAANWKNSNYGLALLNNALLGVLGKLDNINKLGADMSLVYMALVSNPDVYTSMLEHGTTKREASLVTLGSTLAMFSVDKFGHLGEMFFDELTNDGIKSIRATLKHESQSWTKTLADQVKGKAITDKGVKRVLAKSINTAKGFYKDFFDNLKYHSLNGLGKAFGEGLEEVTEEISTDLSKLIYEWAASWKPTNDLFGGLTTDNVGAFDDALNNPDWLKDTISRYGLNFFGGFLGGGIFYAKERFDRKDWKRDTFNDNLIHNVRTYGKNEVMKILDDYHKKGKLGSTKLSAKMQYADGSDSPIFLSAEADGGKTQNDFIYDILAKEVDGIDSIINDKTVVKSDDDLMEKLTLGDVKFMRMSDILLNDYSKGLQSRYGDLATAYTKVRLLINLVLQEIMQADSNIELKEQKRKILEKLQERRENLELQMLDFHSGKNAIDYMGRVLFSIDPNFSGVFNQPDFKSWLHSVHINADGEYTFDAMTDSLFESLNDSEKAALYQKWKEWKSGDNHTTDELAWDAFKYVRDKISPEIADLGSLVGDYKQYLKDIDEVINPATNPLLNARKFRPEDFSVDSDDPLFKIDFSQRLGDETDADYNDRSTLRTGESDEEFKERVEKRLRKMLMIYALNLNNNSLRAGFERIKDILQRNSRFIDSELKRKLKLLLNQSLREVIQTTIDNFKYGGLDDLSLNELKQKLEKVKDDLSDIGEIEDDFKDYLSDHLYGKVTDALETLNGYRELIRWNYARIRGDAGDFMKYDDDMIANMETDEINGVNTIMGLFATIEKDHKDIMTFFEDYVHDGSLDYTEVRKRILLDVVIAHTATLNDDQKEELKQWLKDNKSWDDTDVEQVDNDAVAADKMQDVRDGIEHFNWSPALIFNPNHLTDYEYTAILNNFILIDDDNRAKGKPSLIDTIKSIVLTSTNNVFTGKTDLLLNENMIKFADQENMLLTTTGGYDLNTFKIKKNAGRIDYDYYLDYMNSIFKPINGLRFKMEDIIDLFHDNGRGFLDLNKFMYKLNYADGINAKKLIDLDDQGRVSAVSPTMVGIDSVSEYETRLNNLQSIAHNAIDVFGNRIKNDTAWSLINELDQHTEIENPIIPIVKKLGLAMSVDTDNIIDLLKKIEQERDKNGYLTFTLSANEIQNLEDALQILDIAKAFVMAARKGTSITNPFPHNELINTVAHKNGFMDINFPTMDEELASLYLSTITNLQNEIGKVDANGNYTPFSILDWNTKNAYNKLQQFINSRKSNIDTKLLLFDLNRDLFKTIDRSYDFLPNYELIINSSDSRDVKLARIEQDFYDSFLSFIADNPGLSISEIMDKTGFKKFFDTTANGDLVRNQYVSSLTDKVKYGSLTAYDKLMYVLTIANLSANDFDKFLFDFSKRHPEIAALDILLHISRMGIAAMQDPAKWNEMLKWVHREMPSDSEAKKPLYINAVFQSGNGGAGKTLVVARLELEYAKYVKSYDDSQIVYSGPKESQITSLSKLGIGTGKSIKDILKQIYGESQYNSIREEINDPTHRNRLTAIDSYITLKDDASISYDNTDIKVLVIDEATWIDGVDLALLSRYAQDTGATLLLVGDNYQTGVSKNSNAWNITHQGYTWCARTLRLGITLRDCNIQKYNDILTFSDYIGRIDSIDFNQPDANLKFQNLFDEILHNILMHYYLGDSLLGDMITDSLTDDIIDKIKLDTGPGKKEPLAYFGNDADVLLKLKRKFGDGNVVLFTNADDIQGLEFSNIIIDSPIKLTDHNDPSIVLDWLLRIYMLKTRGKNAAVFIDKNNDLSIIKNIRDSYKNDVSNFNESSIKQFNETFKEYFEKRGVESMSYSTLSTTSAPSSTSVTSTSATAPTTSTSTTTPSTGSSRTAALTGARFSMTVDDGCASNEGTELGIFEDEGIESKAAASTVRFELAGFEEETNTDKASESTADVPDIDSALVYGDNTLSGMSYDVETEKKTTVSGKEYESKHRIYHPDFTSKDTLYDANMYAYAASLNGLEVKDSVSYNEGKDIFFDEFLKFKSCILYHVSYDDAVALCPKIFNSNLLSKRQYENIIQGKSEGGVKFAIEVAPYDKTKDNFIGLSLLSEEEDDMSIATSGGTSPKKLIYKLVLKWSPELSGHANCAITLGMLANPKTFEGNRDKIIDRLQKHLKRNKGDARAKVYLKHIDPKASGYDINSDPISIYLRVIDEYAKQYDNLKNSGTPGGTGFNGTMENDVMSIPIDGSLVVAQSTVIRTAVRNHPGTVPTLRLDISETARKYIDGRTFRESNPDTVISPVYVYRPTNGAATDLPAEAGRCCVFVSRNPAYKPELLLSIWLSELASGSHVKTVRMIRLDNVGVTVSLLCLTNMRDLLRTKPTKWLKNSSGGLEGNVDYNAFPFANDRMGVRWFTELWNWRADMEVFKARITNAFEDPNMFKGIASSYSGFISNNKVRETLISMHEKYQQMHEANENITESEFRSAYDNDSTINPEYRDLAKRINRFNDSLEKTCRRFRLGIGNITPVEGPTPGKIRNEWLLREIRCKEDNPFYGDTVKKGEKVYGIYLSPLLFNNYYGIITDMMKFITNKMKITAKRKVGDNYEDISITERLQLNTKDKKIVNAIWNLEESAPFLITGEHFANIRIKAIPAIVTKMMARSMAYARVKKDADGEYLPNEGIFASRTKRIPWKWEVQGSMFVPLYKTVDGKTVFDDSVKIRHDISDIVKLGDNVATMLELCFHGSTEDVVLAHLLLRQHKEGSKNQPIPQSTDAFAKYGWFSDPFAKRMKPTSGSAGTNTLISSFIETTTPHLLFSAAAKIGLPTMRIMFEKTGNTGLDGNIKTLQEGMEKEMATTLYNDFVARINDSSLSGSAAQTCLSRKTVDEVGSLLTDVTVEDGLTKSDIPVIPDMEATEIDGKNGYYGESTNGIVFWVEYKKTGDKYEFYLTVSKKNKSETGDTGIKSETGDTGIKSETGDTGTKKRDYETEIKTLAENTVSKFFEAINEANETDYKCTMELISESTDWESIKLELDDNGLIDSSDALKALIDLINGTTKAGFSDNNTRKSIRDSFVNLLKKCEEEIDGIPFSEDFIEQFNNATEELGCGK